MAYLTLFSAVQPALVISLPRNGAYADGIAAGAVVVACAEDSGSITFDVHTMVYAAAFVLLGFQSIAFAVFTKFFAISEGLLPPDPTLDKLFQYITLEVGLAVGSMLTIAGLAISVYAVGAWGSKHFGPLDYSHTMSLVILSMLFLTLGAQTVFASFFMSVLGLRRR